MEAQALDAGWYRDAQAPAATFRYASHLNRADATLAHTEMDRADFEPAKEAEHRSLLDRHYMYFSIRVLAGSRRLLGYT